MNKTFPLIGYAPDADPTIWGVITSGAGIRPTERGYSPAYSAVPTNSMTIAASCVGAASLKFTGGSFFNFFGSATKLYVFSGINQSDISRAATYSASTSARWSFCSYGNVVIASNRNDTIQAATVANALSDIAGAPKAAYVETVGQFVFAAYTNEATYGSSPDRWWCSAIGDYRDWATSISTQCVTGRLLSAPGDITGMKAFGDDILIFKRDAIFRGQYVGPPVVWDFQQVPGKGGAWGNEAIVNIGTVSEPRLIFWGPNGFFLFNGDKAARLGDGEIYKTIFDSLGSASQLLQTVMASHNARDKLIHWYYESSPTSGLDKCVIYNYANNKWGVDDRAVTYPFTLQTAYLIGPAPLQTDVVAGFYGTDNKLYLLKSTVSAGTSSSLTLGDLGDDERDLLLARVRPRFLTKPATGTMSDGYRMSLGETLVSDTTVTMGTSGQFDTLREARWHRPTFTFTGNWEMDAISVTMEPGGTE